MKRRRERRRNESILQSNGLRDREYHCVSSPLQPHKQIRGVGMMNAEEIVNRFENPRRSEKGWSLRCPAHDDRNNSLSLSVGDDGKILIHCHVGCPTEDVLERKGLKITDLFTDSNGN